ncbi:hypothetical protein WA158_006313 [Blastocystis sp. Blastoise]
MEKELPIQDILPGNQINNMENNKKETIYSYENTTSQNSLFLDHQSQKTPDKSDSEQSTSSTQMELSQSQLSVKNDSNKNSLHKSKESNENASRYQKCGRWTLNDTENFVNNVWLSIAQNKVLTSNDLSSFLSSRDLNRIYRKIESLYKEKSLFWLNGEDTKLLQLFKENQNINDIATVLYFL